MQLSCGTEWEVDIMRIAVAPTVERSMATRAWASNTDTNGGHDRLKRSNSSHAQGPHGHFVPHQHSGPLLLNVAFLCVRWI